MHILLRTYAQQTAALLAHVGAQSVGDTTDGRIAFCRWVGHRASAKALNNPKPNLNLKLTLRFIAFCAVVILLLLLGGGCHIALRPKSFALVSLVIDMV